MSRKSLLLVLVAAVMTCIFAFAGPSFAASAKTCLFVGITDPEINESDQAVIDHLTKLGWKVTTVDHAAAGDENPDKYGLVVGSSTSTSANIVNAAGYIATATPFLTWESALMDDFLFATDGSAVDLDAVKFVIKDAAHPIVAGFKDSIVPFSDANNIHGGSPMFGHVVCTLDGTAWTALVVAEKGDILLDGKASPGRRVHISGGDNAWANTTADGWKLFDQTVAWLTR